ncbi:MAG: TrkH family potassium uptake protein, partial [Candidatus Hydrogenedens sp.]|nr:TrkH family potassium uptake protein [Candidatus Hydrogenedens sp.]
MNYRFVSRLLGVFCWWVGFWMLLPAGWALWFGERGALGAIAASIGTCLLAGGALLYWGRRANRRMYEREATALVGLGWLLVAALGALPFVYGGVLGPVDAYFESISGFTTTGSSVIAIIEPVPKSILFWRSLTHWLGGIGIVILMVAIIPFLGE